LRRPGEPINIEEPTTAEALQKLGIDLDDVLLGVGIRIGEELASKWDNVQDDQEFWKHLSNEWSQLGMGKIVTNRMPPEKLTVQNGGACGGRPTSNSMLCHLDEGVLKGILRTRHDYVILSTQRVCPTDGSNSCHFEIECEKETMKPPL
jgi:predicted hydrocarbon binding protein